MGWYTALACSGALDPMAGFIVANTMGTLMQEHMIGGQLIYPFVDENWREFPGRREELLRHVAAIDALADHVLALSIDLGGMLVLAGNEAGLQAFEKTVPELSDATRRAAQHVVMKHDVTSPKLSTSGPMSF